MAGIRYKQNSSGIKALLNSAGVRSMLTDKASPVLAAAQASAPFASGEHRNSGHLEQDTTDRAVVRVVFDSDHSLIVEANTGHIARSLDAAG